MATSKRLTKAVLSVERASIIPNCLDGEKIQHLAHELETSVPIVSKWRKRFAQRGLDALRDRARPEKPPVYPRAVPLHSLDGEPSLLQPDPYEVSCSLKRGRVPNLGAMPHVNPFHLKQHVFSDASTVIRNPFVVADNREETQRLRNMSRFSLHEVDQFLEKGGP